MAEKETKSCSDCIHFDVCYKIEHFGRDLEGTSPCEQFVNKDVAPVRHGHWIPQFVSKRGLSDHFMCSECAESTFTPRKFEMIKYAYCPNCGAKMDGGEGK